MNGRWIVLGLGVALLACTRLASAQIERLPHADTTAGNFFGAAVAIDGQQALVGASGEHSCTEQAGAAYVFAQDPVTRRWHRAARLTAHDCEKRRFFGRSVALSGNRALVATSEEEGVRTDPDVVYVFERDTAGVWVQTATLTTGDTFPDGTTGTVVALEGDHAILTTWGDTSTGRYGGAAYVFRYDAGTRRWREAERLTGSGGVQQGIFGGDVAIHGSKVVVPSSQYLQNKPGSVYVFEQNLEGSWRESVRINEVDDFFIAVDVDEDRLLAGQSRAGQGRSGMATIYAPDSTGVWRQTATLVPPTPYRHGAFGSAVALSGDRALVVGFDEQLQLDYNINRVTYVYAFDAEARSWKYQGIIDIGHVAFGSAVDLDGRLALIGAASENAPGAAYIVRIH